MSDRGIPTGTGAAVTGLTDADLDAIVACLPDCVEVYGPYRPRHAPECRHDDITALVVEVRRLRGRLGEAQDAYLYLARERDRFRDGIHNVSGWLVREADEGLSVEPDTVLLMLGALLDDQEDVVLAERCACGRHLPCRHCDQEDVRG